MVRNMMRLPAFRKSKNLNTASKAQPPEQRDVTLKIAPHLTPNTKLPEPLASREDVLKLLPGGHDQQCEMIYESSLDGIGPKLRIYANYEGFVGAAIRAWAEHLHLVVRPDDIWVAILTQLSFYIVGHAEELRYLFVEHKGKKQLVVQNAFNDYKRFIAEINELIGENITDPSFKEWVAPTFSTTTQTDRTVCSAVLMGAMKEYFVYVNDAICGIPSVTLQGTKSDWELLRTKLRRLPSLGVEPEIWAEQLDTVITNMVNCFDDDKQVQNLNFWEKIVHHNGMCGGDYYTGWITAFCFWTPEGRRRRSRQKSIGIGPAKFGEVIDEDLPTAFVEVPLLVRDSTTERERDACILAGSFAVQGYTSKEAAARGLASIDTLQPLSTWMIYEKKEQVGKGQNVKEQKGMEQPDKEQAEPEEELYFAGSDIEAELDSKFMLN